MILFDLDKPRSTAQLVQYTRHYLSTLTDCEWDPRRPRSLTHWSESRNRYLVLASSIQTTQHHLEHVWVVNGNVFCMIPIVVIVVVIIISVVDCVALYLAIRILWLDRIPKYQNLIWLEVPYLHICRCPTRSWKKQYVRMFWLFVFVFVMA